jgi:hypothetical protein
MDQDSKLRSCPLCGGTAEWEYRDFDADEETGDDGTGFVKCQSCGLELFGGFQEEAENQWNVRACA